MIGWTWRRLRWVLQKVGAWYNDRPYWGQRKPTVYERLDRIEYWIKVHHPLISTSASPEEVKQRGYWEDVP